MTIKLTAKQEALVREAIDSGLVSSAEEFVSDALRNQRDELAHKAALREWLRDVVVPGHQAYLNDPSTGRTLDQIRAELLDE